MSGSPGATRVVAAPLLTTPLSANCLPPPQHRSGGMSSRGGGGYAEWAAAGRQRRPAPDVAPQQCRYLFCLSASRADGLRLRGVPTAAVAPDQILVSGKTVSSLSARSARQLCQDLSPRPPSGLVRS